MSRRAGSTKKKKDKKAKAILEYWQKNTIPRRAKAAPTAHTPSAVT
jgi:hypothetical protein